MKKCTRCKEDLDESMFYKSARYGLNYYCKNCERIYNREKRQSKKSTYVEKDKRYYNLHREEILKKRRDWYEVNKTKQKAHQSVRDALYKGNMVRKELCEDCGEKSVLAHHENYGKPLDVVWLCAKCHMIRHHGE